MHKNAQYILIVMYVLIFLFKIRKILVFNP